MFAPLTKGTRHPTATTLADHGDACMGAVPRDKSETSVLLPIATKEMHSLKSVLKSRNTVVEKKVEKTAAGPFANTDGLHGHCRDERRVPGEKTVEPRDPLTEH